MGQSVTRLSQYLILAFSCNKRPETGVHLVFLCGEGRFAKQTMERSDFCEPKAALCKRAALARASEEPEVSTPETTSERSCKACEMALGANILIEKQVWILRGHAPQDDVLDGKASQALRAGA